MRGDEAQRIAAGREDSRVRRGPRHAAPRKSLLTKLQIPAGKAMALAAMPTAVFVGMGLTPRLALADDSRDIPYAPGPCVTRSDDPDASASPSASESPKPGESPSATPAPSASGTAGPGGDGTGPRPPGSSAPEPPGSTPPDAPADPGPTPTKTRNPLDPLGLGDALGDLLGLPGEKPANAPASGAPAAGKPGEKPAGKPAAGQEPDRPVGDAVDGAVDGAADATKDAIKDAAEKAGATVEELDEDAKGLDAREDEDLPAGADGKEPFPCPTADPDALAAAELEPSIPLLPDDPWTLRSSVLTLNGLDYHGIVEVKTGSGKIKKALKFTAATLDIKDLHQTVVYPAGRTAHVKARAGSTSTIRGGEVTMYTEELKGNLFGLIPITFSPETPPPVNVPFAFFTDVQVTQAGQFGGTLTVPGLQNYLTD
ncbi:hypothetical protein [Streptomyces sp. AK02-01A]|uniref:hypothetical protein n=1 Tax=Streptomyces sp. AK02-01A TaxID=3028648 RepID=UPI0029B3AE84|nr:hypothetical protein [Streptomyces sp. AK02-01A]MDX3854719.1 hypothetical protein [Streptomyces sp. AK02-01A]